MGSFGKTSETTAKATDSAILLWVVYCKARSSCIRMKIKIWQRVNAETCVSMKKEKVHFEVGKKT